MTGVIRPIDLAADNSIPSSKVANAKIAYGGKGALADANAPGLAVALLQFTVDTVLMSDSNIRNAASAPAFLHRRWLLASLVLAGSAVQRGAGARRAHQGHRHRGRRAQQPAASATALVVGLDGTGDQTTQAPFTIQSIANMLAKFGVTIPAEHQPAAEERRGGDGHRRSAAVRQARPDHRRHGGLHRQRGEPARRAAADDAAARRWTARSMPSPRAA